MTVVDGMLNTLGAVFLGRGLLAIVVQGWQRQEDAEKLAKW